MIYAIISAFVTVWIWIIAEWRNAPTYDEKTGRFYYKKKNK